MSSWEPMARCKDLTLISRWKVYQDEQSILRTIVDSIQDVARESKRKRLPLVRDPRCTSGSRRSYLHSSSMLHVYPWQRELPGPKCVFPVLLEPPQTPFSLLTGKVSILIDIFSTRLFQVEEIFLPLMSTASETVADTEKDMPWSFRNTSLYC